MGATVKKLELTLFGTIEIHQAGDLVTGFKSIKAQALLCYLAVTGQPHTRSTLAGLLWGGMPETNARMNLSQALSSLRRFYPGCINTTRQKIALRRDRDIWVDVNIFEARVNSSSSEANMPALEEAIQLYRGDFLENFYVGEAPEFDSWVMIERARLRDLALKTLQILAVHYASQGKTGWATAIDYTNRMLNIEPWQEDAHRLMMFLQAVSGQRSAALVQYNRCRQILADELDVEPEVKTTALYERIRDGKLSSWPEEETFELLGFPYKADPPKHTTSHDIPVQTPLFVGRGTELNQLADLLSNSGVRLVTIVGMGGIGKTQLALTMAHRLAKAKSFQDGIYFVPLTSVTTYSRLLSAIADQVGLSLAGTRQPEEVIFNFLGHKVCLLILDNFEQLLPEVVFLSHLSQIASQSKIIVTSRERLKLREEWVLDLDGLPYPDTLRKGQSTDYDAIILFCKLAQQVRSSFSLEKEFPGVARICQLTQGMPLALEQAASLIRLCQAAEIADQIEQRLDALTTTLLDLPERHHSMRAVFDETWHWLSESEQMVFCRLSVFQGGFTREAAEQVAGATLKILASLADKSLIRIGIGHGEITRYDLHELVRQYAADRLLEAGQAQVTKTRVAHFDFFLALAERAKQFSDTREEGEWLKRFEMDRGNLYAALSWANEQAEADRALRLNAALMTFWLYNSPAKEAIYWLETSLSMRWDKQSQVTMQVRAQVLIVTGYAALQISDLKLAKLRFQEGIELNSKLGGQWGMAWCLRGSGLVCLIQGDLLKAQNFMQESWDICQENQKEIENNPEVAVQLFGAAQARRDSFEMVRWANQEIEYQHSLMLTKNQVSVADWQAAWEKGYAMDPQEGVAFALTYLQTL
jgi:predicted ATPase/DNA-binding SARP family transcriptional activator